jgi:hypothetical protein
MHPRGPKRQRLFVHGTTPRLRELALVRQSLRLEDHNNVEYDDDGWDSPVYMVNRGEAVFKLPRSTEAKLQYQREVRVVEALQTIDSPILIPLSSGAVLTCSCSATKG